VNLSAPLRHHLAARQQKSEMLVKSVAKQDNVLHKAIRSHRNKAQGKMESNWRDAAMHDATDEIGAAVPPPQPLLPHHTKTQLIGAKLLPRSCNKPTIPSQV
jgi:hypothetical protein